MPPPEVVMILLTPGVLAPERQNTCITDLLTPGVLAPERDADRPECETMLA